MVGWLLNPRALNRRWNEVWGVEGEGEGEACALGRKLRAKLAPGRPVELPPLSELTKPVSRSLDWADSETQSDSASRTSRLRNSCWKRDMNSLVSSSGDEDLGVLQTQKY